MDNLNLNLELGLGSTHNLWSPKITRLWQAELEPGAAPNSVVSETTEELTVDEIIQMIQNGVAGENLVVNGNLNLSNSQVKSLPCKLTIYGGLHLGNTPIKELPEDLTIYGYLNLSNTPIKRIPRSLKFDGYLDISGCTNIKSLPYNLIEINGYLDASHSGLTQIKADPPKHYSYRVINNIILEEHWTDAEEYDYNDLDISGYMWDYTDVQFTTITPQVSNLVINGFLDISGCNGLYVNSKNQIPPYDIVITVKPHNKLNTKRTTGFVDFTKLNSFISADNSEITADQLSISTFADRDIAFPLNITPSNVILEKDFRNVNQIVLQEGDY